MNSGSCSGRSAWYNRLRGVYTEYSAECNCLQGVCAEYSV